MDNYLEAAKKVLENIAPWDREGITPEALAEDIKQNPLDTITFLLDTIDHLEAELWS